MGKVFVDNSPLLLLPSTRRQEEGAATVQDDQRVSRCWRRLGGGLVKFSNEFELNGNRYGEGCMHGAFLELWV
jgi:hypothetical protein